MILMGLFIYNHEVIMAKTIIPFAPGPGDDSTDDAKMVNGMVYVTDEGHRVVRPRPALAAPDTSTVNYGGYGGSFGPMPQGIKSWRVDDATASGSYNGLYVVMDDVLFWDVFGGGRGFNLGALGSYDWTRVYFSTFYVGGAVNLVIYKPSGLQQYSGGTGGSDYLFTKVEAEATNPVNQSTLLSTGPYQASKERVHGIVNLNGYLFIMTTDKEIYNCDSDDITTWSSSNFVSSERFNDDGMYLARHKDHIVSINSESIEFFYDAANATNSPLSRRNDLYHSFGTRFPNTVVEQGDTIVLVGKPSDSSVNGVYTLKNFQLSKISTPAQDRDIEKTKNAYGAYAQTSDFASIVSTPAGTFYVLTLARPQETGQRSALEPFKTWVYHFELDKWYQWTAEHDHTVAGAITSTNNIEGVFHDDAEVAAFITAGAPVGRYNSAAGVVFGVIGSTDQADTGFNNPDPDRESHPIVLMADGQVRSLRSETLIENETGTSWEIDCNAFDVNTDQRKRIKNVRLLTTPDYSASGASCPLDVSYTKEMPTDGTYTTPNVMDVAAEKKVLYRQGICRQRRYKITLDSGDVVSYTDIPHLKGLEIEYDELRG